MRPKFGFALDIDGVLLRGAHVIPRANAALQFLRRAKIPHVLLTNGGGLPEEVFVRRLEERGVGGVLESQVVLAHTPMKRYVEEYGDEVVVIMGRKQSVQAARCYGYRLACTPEEYCTVHDLFPFANYSEPMSEELRDAIKTKPVAMVAVFSDPLLWGRDIQVSDVKNYYDDLSTLTPSAPFIADL